MRWIAVGMLIAVASEANAECIGSEAMMICTDAYGNSYTVNKLGSMTMMDGYNPRTGSRWHQDSQTLGGMTFHSGTAADGERWNMTEQQLGGSTLFNGTDSDGNPFSATCDQFGCY